MWFDQVTVAATVVIDDLWDALSNWFTFSKQFVVVVFIDAIKLLAALLCQEISNCDIIFSLAQSRRLAQLELSVEFFKC